LSKRLKATLSEASLDQLKKELKDLAETLNKDVDKSTKELGKKSLEYMQKQYSQKGMENHIANINLKPYKNNYKKGFIISSGNDEVAVYNEFGTGIVGSENPNTLANKAGYKYNLNSPHKGVIPEGAKHSYTQEYLEAVTTPDTWWYFKNGKWWHTKGMKAKNMYSSLVDELNENAVRDLKASISQSIGSYGGK
jgi:hypothetical protein